MKSYIENELPADTETIPLVDLTRGSGGFAVEGEPDTHVSPKSVGGAGDVDGDGLADVIVGAYLADPNGVRRAGRSYVVFGKASTGRVLLADVALGSGGGGGTLTTPYDEERTYYGRKKMEQIKASGAEMFVTLCHACHGQINDIKKAYGMENLEVKYLWELVLECMSI